MGNIYNEKSEELHNSPEKTKEIIGTLFQLKTGTEKTVNNIIKNPDYSENDIERGKQYAIEELRKIYFNNSIKHELFSRIIKAGNLGEQITRYYNRLSGDKKEKFIKEFYNDFTDIIKSLDKSQVDIYLRDNPDTELHIYNFDHIISKILEHKKELLLSKYGEITGHKEQNISKLTEEQLEIYENYLDGIKPTINTWVKPFIKLIPGNRSLEIDFDEINKIFSQMHYANGSNYLFKKEGQGYTINTFQDIQELIKDRVEELGEGETVLEKHKRKNVRYNHEIVSVFEDSPFGIQFLGKNLGKIIPDSKESKMIIKNLHDFIKKYGSLLNDTSLFQLSGNNRRGGIKLNRKEEYFKLERYISNISYIESVMKINLL